VTFEHAIRPLCFAREPVISPCDLGIEPGTLGVTLDDEPIGVDVPLLQPASRAMAAQMPNA
jgi:hypothetical protein